MHKNILPGICRSNISFSKLHNATTKVILSGTVTRVVL